MKYKYYIFHLKKNTYITTNKLEFLLLNNWKLLKFTDISIFSYFAFFAIYWETIFLVLFKLCSNSIFSAKIVAIILFFVGRILELWKIRLHLNTDSY